jgi:hypothetical protein
VPTPAKPSEVADIVSSTVSIQRASVTRQGFTPLLLSRHDKFAGRTATYKGERPVALAAMEDAGFVPGVDPAWEQAEALLGQRPAPPFAKVGRAEDGESWAEAMAAVDLEDPDWYGVCIPDRDAASILSLSAFVHGSKFGLAVCQTKDAAVLDGLDGNVLLQLQAAPAKQRTALLWHDPEVATGADYPEMLSDPGPWDVTPGSTLVVGSQADDEQVVPLPGTAASRAGSVAGPWDFTGGNGWILAVRFDEDLGGVGLGPAEIQIPIVQAAYPGWPMVTAAQLLAVAQAAVGQVGTVSAPADKLTIASKTFGSKSSARFSAATTDALATLLGITEGKTDGTGAGADMSALTAAELAAAAAGTVGMTWAATTDGRARMRGTVKGRWGYVRVAGGAANQAIGFDRAKVSGPGALEDYADAAILGATLPHDLDSRAMTWCGLPLTDIAPDRIRRDKSIALRDAFCNTYEFRSSAQPEGELREGRLTVGRFVDNQTTADWLALRLAEDFLADLALKNKARDKYTFETRSYGTACYRLTAARLSLAAAAGHISGPDLGDWRKTGRDTGLIVPTLEEVPQANRDARRWGPIRYRQQIAGAAHGAILEGVLFEG